MRKHVIAGLFAAFSLAGLPAVAADNGIYLGASVGQSGVEVDEVVDGFDFDYDASTTAYKIIAGWRFLDWLAVEGNYVDLGSGEDKVSGDKVEIDVSGVSLSAVGFLPVGPVDLFARVGAVNWDADVSVAGFDAGGSADGTDFTYGAGVQFRVWSLGIRAEYEVFDISDADNVDLLSLGVTWTFL
ncbi:MAG: outer membrane beta-barrel protein [Rhodospirillaceae bacterium]